MFSKLNERQINVITLTILRKLSKQLNKAEKLMLINDYLEYQQVFQAASVYHQGTLYRGQAAQP